MQRKCQKEGNCGADLISRHPLPGHGTKHHQCPTYSAIPFYSPDILLKHCSPQKYVEICRFSQQRSRDFWVLLLVNKILILGLTCFFAPTRALLFPRQLLTKSTEYRQFQEYHGTMVPAKARNTINNQPRIKPKSSVCMDDEKTLQECETALTSQY